MFRLVFIGPKLVELVVLVDDYVQQVLTVRQLKCLVLWVPVVLVLQLRQQVQLVSLLLVEPTAATPHTPTSTTAAIVVIRRCFIARKLSSIPILLMPL